MRLNRGLTQEELAKKAGVSESTVSAAELGRRSPHLPSVLKICAALHYPPEQLLVPEDNIYPSPDSELEAQFSELLDQYLASQKNLYTFMYRTSAVRPRLGISPIAAAEEVRARVPPNRKSSARKKREKKP